MSPMKPITLLVFRTLALGLAMTASPRVQALGQDNLPVAPISSTPFLGWTNTYRLSNEDITIVVVPAIGRIMYIGPDATTNLLHAPELFHGLELGCDGTNQWRNIGGDWIWPVSQKHWPLFQRGDWPPSVVIDGCPWSGRAWLNAGGVQSCLLQREFPAPLNIKVTRLIKLPTNGASFTIEQRIERTAESSIPVTLWNITQVAAPARLLFPLTSTARVDPRYLLMMGSPPDAETLPLCNETAVFNTATDVETKIGAYSTNSWVAALAGPHLLIETASPSSKPQSAYPDGGCSIEIYANKGLGYAEIENLSPEALLEPGETLANELRFTLLTLESTPEDPCELAGKVTSSLVFPPEVR